MSRSKTIDHSGSSFDSFLEREGLLEETEAVAIKRVLVWQLEQAMRREQVTKKSMAKRLRTSRTQVDRLLNPTYIGVSLGTVAKAARAVGKRIRVEIVDADSGRVRESERRLAALGGSEPGLRESPRRRTQPRGGRRAG